MAEQEHLTDEQYLTHVRDEPPTTFSEGGLKGEVTAAATRFGAELGAILETYAAPPAPPPPPEPPPTTNAWDTGMAYPPGYGAAAPFLDDDFKADTLNRTNWTPSVGDPRGIWKPSAMGGTWDENAANIESAMQSRNIGGFNAEFFASSQVRTGLDDGCSLTAVRNNKWQSLGYDWMSGIIRSRVLITGRGGMARVWAKMASGSGNWSAMWLMNGEGDTAEPDIIETGFMPWASGANVNSSVAVTLHQPGPGPGISGGVQQMRYNAGVDLTDRFNCFDIVYHAGEDIRWFFNGAQRWRLTIPNWDVNRRFCFMANLSVFASTASSWAHQVNAQTPSPMTMFIRRVQFFVRP